MKPHENLDPLVIAGKSYSSRLMVGTGKYKDFAETKAAVEASGAQIVTVAIRRTNIGQNPGEPSLLEAIQPSRYTLLPNTAGCYTADDAVRTLRLARELLDGHDLVKRRGVSRLRQVLRRGVSDLHQRNHLFGLGCCRPTFRLCL